MFAVFRQADQPGLAMRLLERVVAPEALARFARLSGRTPSRRSAIELVAPDAPFLSRTAELLETAASRPWLPSYPAYWPSCRRCSKQSSPVGSALRRPRSERPT